MFQHCTEPQHHDINTFCASLIFLRQTGHGFFFSLAAHSPQDTKWPQGTKTVSATASMQMVHSGWHDFACSLVARWSKASMLRFSPTELLGRSSAELPVSAALATTLLGPSCAVLLLSVLLASELLDLVHAGLLVSTGAVATMLLLLLPPPLLLAHAGSLKATSGEGVIEAEVPRSGSARTLGAAPSLVVFCAATATGCADCLSVLP